MKQLFEEDDIGEGTQDLSYGGEYELVNLTGFFIDDSDAGTTDASDAEADASPSSENESSEDPLVPDDDSSKMWADDDGFYFAPTYSSYEGGGSIQLADPVLGVMIETDDASYTISTVNENGNSGSDWVSTGAGNDTLSTGEGDDSLDSWDGNDQLDSGSGNDNIFAGDGDDTLSGGDGDDYLDGWSGNDQSDGGNGNDFMFGFDGNDTLTGGAGDDTLVGEAGNDILQGGDGNDFLTTQEGTDTLDGGAGNDTFEVSHAYSYDYYWYNWYDAPMISLPAVEEIDSDSAEAGKEDATTDLIIDDGWFCYLPVFWANPAVNEDITLIGGTGEDTLSLFDFNLSDVSAWQQTDSALAIHFENGFTLTVADQFSGDDNGIEHFIFGDGSVEAAELGNLLS